MNRNVGRRLACLRRQRRRNGTARAGALAGQAGRLPYVGRAPVHDPDVCARANGAVLRISSQGELRTASFGGVLNFHSSSKNPARAIAPGAREEIGTLRSTIAQSGSFGTWRALFK